jgi:hypothetical protein
MSTQTQSERIRRKCLELLDEAPKGLRYSELKRSLEATFPDIKPQNFPRIIVALSDLSDITKPAKGLFIHKRFQAEPQPPEASDEAAMARPLEKEFYVSFADYLENELQECTKAIALGGNVFGDKWGTPDVFGIQKPRDSDIFKPPIEVLSAEIKTNTSGLITAFGQACAYKLFSHRSYIVVPSASPKPDLERLDALCLVFGIGLVRFEADNVKRPAYDIRVRAARHEPDGFYVNRCLKAVGDLLNL